MSETAIVGYVVKVPNPDANYVDYVIIEVETRRLFLWPERLIKAGPTHEQRTSGRVSNSQLSDLSPSKAWYGYHVGQRVHCKVVDDRRSIVSCVERHGNVPRAERKCHSHPRDSVMVYDTVCVFSDGNPRQCYSLDLKEVEVDQDYVRAAMPNVPLHAYIQFVLDFEAMSASYRLHSIADDNSGRPIVALGSRIYLDCVPWLPTRRTTSAYPMDEVAEWDVVADEVDRFMDAMQAEHEPREILKACGFFLDDRRIFCKNASMRQICVAWTAPEYRDIRWAGRVVEFDAYDCRLNRCYVVYRWRETTMPIGCRITAEDGALFKAGLHPTGFTGIYKNQHVGFVRDARNLLDEVRVTEDDPAWVYIQYSSPGRLHCFDVSCIATECYAGCTLVAREEDTVVTCDAVVVGPHGELFAKELYNYRCILPVTLQGQFIPGCWVEISVKRNAVTKDTTVLSASALQRRPLTASYNSDGTQIRLKIAVRPLDEHPEFFWSSIFGPVRSPNKSLPTLARFRGVQPLIVVRDGSAHSEDARFICVTADRRSFERPTA